MPNKLTDSEIVKALECCINWKKEGDCAKCPAYERPFFCTKELRTRSLDLINRLQAENKNLQERNVILKGLVDTQKAENERLRNQTTTYITSISELTNEVERLRADRESAMQLAADIIAADKTLKAEAYKEVFEKLNDKAIVTKMKLYGNWFIVKGVTLHDINTLKKEMVGEDNESKN